MKILEILRKHGGFWLNPVEKDEVGCIHVFRHGRRFAPPDDPVMRECAERPRPRFIELEELEKKYGRLVAILDKCADPKDLCQPILWFERAIATILHEDMVVEYLLILPRSPPEEAELAIEPPSSRSSAPSAGATNTS